MTIKTLSVECPTCKTEVLMTPQSPERPFCSKRCKMIDFGGWAAEKYNIPGESVVHDALEGYEQEGEY